jgi:hypothetical protein
MKTSMRYFISTRMARSQTITNDAEDMENRNSHPLLMEM